jgi:gamma-aminobutyric acid type B receptor
VQTVQCAEFAWPRDSTQEHYERQYIGAGVYVFMCVLSLMGVALALVFLVINIVFRSHRCVHAPFSRSSTDKGCSFIRMSSPNLNNLIIVGSILVYVSVYVLGIDTRQVSEDAFAVVCYVSLVRVQQECDAPHRLRYGR